MGDTSATQNSSANALCASYDPPSTEMTVTLACSVPVAGRYLVVRMRPEYYGTGGCCLQLCEVKAYGAVAPPPPRHAPGRGVAADAYAAARVHLQLL